MVDNKETAPRRKHNRWDQYDYSTVGSYFVTICCAQRRKIFWKDSGQKVTSQDEVVLSDMGRIVEQGIRQIGEHYSDVCVEKYCIMPDHIHMMIFIPYDQENGEAPSLSLVVGQMKRWVSKMAGGSIWQKSFFDRVIRSDKEYANIWRYIDNNPMNKDRDDHDDVLELFDKDSLILAKGEGWQQQN